MAAMELPLNKPCFSPVCLTDPVTTANCYIIPCGNDCLIIDPGNFTLLNEYLRKSSLHPKAVLLTHEHCDHIGGLNQLRADWNVTVAASSPCSAGMQDTRENMSRMMELFLFYKSGETKLVPYAPFACAPADLHFSDTLSFSFFDLLFQMRLLPGHTHGSSVIICGSSLFTGDYLIPGEPVMTRLPGGSDVEYEQFAKPWLGRVPDGYQIFPGHGQPYLMNQEVKRGYGLS